MIYTLCTDERVKIRSNDAMVCSKSFFFLIEKYNFVSNIITMAVQTDKHPTFCALADSLYRVSNGRTPKIPFPIEKPSLSLDQWESADRAENHRFRNSRFADF